MPVAARHQARHRDRTGLCGSRLACEDVKSDAARVNAKSCSPASRLRFNFSKRGRDLHVIGICTATLIRLPHDLAPALIGRRPPLADVFNVAMTPRADFVFVEPADADARRWHSRADVAEQRFRRSDRRCANSHWRLPSLPSRASKSMSSPACCLARRWSISLNSSSLLSQIQCFASSS